MIDSDVQVTAVYNSLSFLHMIPPLSFIQTRRRRIVIYTFVLVYVDVQVVLLKSR